MFGGCCWSLFVFVGCVVLFVVRRSSLFFAVCKWFLVVVCCCRLMVVVSLCLLRVRVMDLLFDACCSELSLVLMWFVVVWY